MQKTGGHKRFYARHGLVTRPVHLAPEEAEAIRQAAFHAHCSQQQWMREVLTGLRSVAAPPQGARLPVCPCGWQPPDTIRQGDLCPNCGNTFVRWGRRAEPSPAVKLATEA